LAISTDNGVQFVANGIIEVLGVASLPNISVLTHREAMVLALAGQGLDNREISAHLGVAPNTVKVHLRNIIDKLGVRNRTQLGLIAALSGLVDRWPPPGGVV